MKLCLDCGALAHTSVCPTCQRQRDAKQRETRGNTTQRGYGAEHQRHRRAALAAYHPTDPCCRCGEPLGSDPSNIADDHTDDRRGYRGLSHRRCNDARKN